MSTCGRRRSLTYVLGVITRMTINCEIGILKSATMQMLQVNSASSCPRHARILRVIGDCCGVTNDGAWPEPWRGSITDGNTLRWTWWFPWLRTKPFASEWKTHQHQTFQAPSDQWFFWNEKKLFSATRATEQHRSFIPFLSWRGHSLKEAAVLPDTNFFFYATWRSHFLPCPRRRAQTSSEQVFLTPSGSCRHRQKILTHACVAALRWSIFCQSFVLNTAYFHLLQKTEHPAEPWWWLTVNRSMAWFKFLCF